MVTLPKPTVEAIRGLQWAAKVLLATDHPDRQEGALAIYGGMHRLEALGELVEELAPIADVRRSGPLPDPESGAPA